MKPQQCGAIKTVEFI